MPRCMTCVSPLLNKIVVGCCQQETVNPAFVLLGTCLQGIPVILRELLLLDGFDPVSFSFTLIRKFKKQLSYCRNRLNITHIQPILTARVPILKVSFSNSFEADISFSNYLALSNTRMLAFYTKVEPKLRTLGIALKTVTKITKIGRAAAGGISSYAWIIMLIHYLQQIDQLPVLQELYEGSTKPTNLVNGWNVWYQNDLSVIVSITSSY
ncbi:unnamed protein product [Schistosoma mattheei]|uniref:Poly(A) RNA polymerase mitochondrial-like central palm domain-containing protein n=2 Tax=Schistosoma TaxID=6181 RepID=A0A183NJ32_9TREM|nr:unnamed protein product [Schistosoma mattheei]